MPCGGLVQDFKSRAQGKKQLLEPWRPASIGVGVVAGEEPVLCLLLNRSLRAICPGPLPLVASLAFTLPMGSAERDRVERIETLERVRRRFGTGSRGVEASGETGGVTSWEVPRADSTIDANQKT